MATRTIQKKKRSGKKIKANSAQVETLSRREIDNWPVSQSGLNARAVHCLEQTGVGTVGDLRNWKDDQLLNLRNFGTTTLKNVRWFFRWTGRLEEDKGTLSDFRSILREFLRRSEVFVLEQRYGLTDPLFRPLMKRRTLQEIARMRGGVTRERVRQVEETGLLALGSNLCRATSAALEAYWVDQIQSRGGVITSAELVELASDPMLGGYQPWGALLLMSEVWDKIHFRNDFFSSLPPAVLNRLEKAALQHLQKSRTPLPLSEFMSKMPSESAIPERNRTRVMTVVLEQHPQISATSDRRYFIPMTGAAHLIADILKKNSRSLHFHEITRLYNEKTMPRSHKGTGFILRVLNMMSEAQRVSPAVYRLKKN